MATTTYTAAHRAVAMLDVRISERYSVAAIRKAVFAHNFQRALDLAEPMFHQAEAAGNQNHEARSLEQFITVLVNMIEG